MSNTLEFELKRRWKLCLTTGPDDEYDLIVIVDSVQELASQFMVLRTDPAISSIEWARYYGSRAAGSWREQPALAGSR